MKQGELKQVLTLPLLTFYGVGTILGAGIYVLVGKVAGHAGMFTPFAFMVASVLAAFSAFSYAELAARFPKNAGEAIYIQQGFHSRDFGILVGLLISLAGIVSTATLMNGMAGYLRVFVDVPPWLLIACAVILLGAIVTWGIGESVWIAAVMTVVEVGGLLLILWVGRDSIAELPARATELLPPMEKVVWHGIIVGALLSFYAFIGFEDIVNVAEEVKNPVRTVPRAVLLSLLIATVLYFLVSLVSILVVEPAVLAQSDAPLAMLYQRATGEVPLVITAISVVSVANGALVQIIMASRLIHGMHGMGWGHRHLGFIHPVTSTPVVAIVIVTMIVLVFALSLGTVSLAKITSFIALTVFTLINLALWRIKLQQPVHNGFRVPLWVPVCGFFCSFVFVVYQFI